MFLLDSTPGKMSRNNKQSNLIKGKHRISKNTTSKPEEREDIERLLNEIEEWECYSAFFIKFNVEYFSTVNPEYESIL